MKFSDGMEFDTTSTSYRVVRKTDGYYVVGRGMLIPVEDTDEAYRTIDELLANEGHSSR
jgi:hypothetical protein